MKDNRETIYEECFYCGMPASRYEKDHFPIAKRHGGTETVVSCMTCHEVKDRLALHKMDASFVIGNLKAVWDKCDARERVILAKFLSLAMDGINDRKAKSQESGGVA